METNDHILLGCPFARAAWFGSNLSFSMPDGESASLPTMIQNWDKMISLSKQNWSPEEVFLRAQWAFDEYYSLTRHHHHHGEESQPGSILPPQLTWKQPEIGHMKINCDAALPLEPTGGGLGVVIRNQRGEILWATSIPVSFFDALLGEFWVVRSTLIDAKDLELTHIIVESDNATVVDTLNHQLPSLPVRAMGFIQDIHSLANQFETCQFVHISRGANQVAHTLARKALSLASKTD
ncbi:uncharacterized protein LOC122658960 [Telopea speciosissima]|uniref:uncharacterized protein LOC122658960 n=1 Tax=Telopea speciosissima TaxID=54955 RepID=UPI001CC4863F|nr:uncharacterized protein LOC122658960 [Telopea speciosissima]